MIDDPVALASRRASVAVGVLGRGPGGAVDGSGRLLVDGTIVEWWIGAQDRWHRPALEVALRQERLDGAPVVQAALRIPGGDARVTTYGAVLDGSDWIVLDIENVSSTPFAVAVVTRTAPPRTGARWSLDGAVLRRDGEVLSLAARPADACCDAGDLDELAGRLAEAYIGDGASLPAASAEDGETARSAAVLAQVFAVSHGSGLRVLIAPDAAGRTAAATAQPAAAPAPAAVARGWRRQLDAGTRCNLGDEAAETALLRRRADLLLDGHRDRSAGATDARVDPLAISALAAFGHDEAAATRLDRLLASLRAPLEPSAAAAALLAAADVVDWSPDGAALAALLAAPAVELGGWAARSKRSGTASRAVPAEGEEASPAAVAAWAVERIAARAALAGSASSPDAGGAGGRGAGPISPASIARFRNRAGRDEAAGLLALRRQLVDDDADGVLELLGGWEPSWRGRALDVHALPTVAGPLSFALRWHGSRPALLWQLEDVEGAVGVDLRCLRLDPAFRSTRRQGEALLQEPDGPPFRAEH